MELWAVRDDPDADGVLHEVAPGFGHAILASAATYLFTVLDVPASIWQSGSQWLPLHTTSPVLHFEFARGKETERYDYNARAFSAVHAQCATYRGEFAGFSDLFVPIRVDRAVAGILVVGPFGLSRLTGSEIRQRWRELSGSEGQITDPEFAAYLAGSLATLVLDKGRAPLFEKALGHLADLLAGVGRADTLANRLNALLPKLEEARFSERSWSAVRSMSDERYTRTWHSAANVANLRRLGITKPADGVLVGLTASIDPARDPVDEAVARDGFQRASVELGRKLGGAVAGQVGDHGVVFLVEGKSASARRRGQRLEDLAERAADLARRRFGLALHSGFSVASDSVLVSRSYQSALGAAESALAQGRKILGAEASARPVHHTLRHLRQALGRAVEERPELLAARFEHYVQAVLAESGHRLDPMRGLLEAGFESLVLPLLKSGLLDDKGFEELSSTLDRAAKDARTSQDLLAAYRRMIADAAETLHDPSAARQGRSIRRAREYIQAHYREPIRCATVARIAGFSPGYFSLVFKEQEGKTFEHYVQALRVARAKQLLTTTALPIGRIAELCGFQSAEYFARVFRRSERRTPRSFRTAWTPKGEMTKIQRVPD